MNQRKESPWQLIYIDMMTNVMCFFVVLWALSQGKEAAVKESIGDVKTRMIQLPSDILFSSGSALLSEKGRTIFRQLFQDEKEEILNFKAGGLARRMIVVHGHTDSAGKKADNLLLGYRRAVSALYEISRYSQDVIDHITVCTHADNSPAEIVPKFRGKMTRDQRSLWIEAMQKNRRITIEDKLQTQDFDLEP